MRTIFDIGMYDGSDTDYYLSEGYKVVAVEANHNLVNSASRRFRHQIKTGQLIVINRAICDGVEGNINLYLAGDDLGSSSIYRSKVLHKNHFETHNVKSASILELMSLYGNPYFIKVDIEGADRHCILPLKDDRFLPHFISFEAGTDTEELIDHLWSIGYKRFKAVNQCNLADIDDQDLVKGLSFRDQGDRLYSTCRRESDQDATEGSQSIEKRGKSKPGCSAEHLKRRIWPKKYANIGNRNFLLAHSSGPLPWHCKGKWRSPAEFIARWRKEESKELPGWYDVHVCWS